ncbi:MAG: LysM peptidoglycan-binding domain-containing protein [Gemmatimonadaceae bacterium]|nr:LysM peptidoglycan-binding domain-containing protein [Gemmatimonadaceae bacterium]
MTELPAPIPTEGVWTGEETDLPNWDAIPRRNRRRKRRAPYPPWLKYLGACVALAMILTAAQIAFHAVRSDPRDATVYATRELQLSVLRPNEKVLATVSVWQRPAIDYFRATRGLLVLADAPGDTAHPIGGRLIYLGLQPRDPLSAPDSPPTFDERSWPVDTAVTVTRGRTFFWIARALRITAPREHLTLGVPSGAAANASALDAALQRKYASLRAEGWRRRELRRARDRVASALLYDGRREWYHTVRRGEALASVARMFGTTPEAVRALNGVTGDKIRIGQALRVKGWTRQPVPFPPGVVPENAPPPSPAAVPPTR